jgi:23S rRNA (uridine2552-2'-O)-methyltransferase
MSEEKRRWKGPGDSKPPEGGRTLQQKQKPKKKGLSKSSKEWVDRQLNDPWVRRAQEAGYRARAAWKLKQLDERFNLISKNARMVDLGSAPGGWLQIAIEKGVRHIAGVDLLPVDPLPGAEVFLGDASDAAIGKKLIAAIGGQPTIVLSDMAADTTGHKQTDHVRTVALAEVAARFAVENLTRGGTFVAKVFQGGAQGPLLELLRDSFAEVRHWKPPASRPESPETYVVATGFKGR